MFFISAGYTIRLVTFRSYSSATLFNSFQLALDRCSLTLTQQSHARLLSLGLAQNPFLCTKLISAYAVYGTPNESQLVFNAIQNKNVYLWNSLINGYVKNNAYVEAFDLFAKMGKDNILPDDYTLATLSKVAGELRNASAGKIIHGKSIRIGFVLDCVLANSIMSMYGKCEEFGDVRKLFDEMSQRNVGSWNVLISEWAKSGNHNFGEELRGLVKYMQIEGLKPDAFTVSSLLPLCIENFGKRNHGKELHGFVVRNGLDMGSGSDVHLCCSLIDMYSRSGKVHVAMRVFERMKCINVHAWTAMVNGHVLSGDFDKALDLFREMLVKGGVEPNKVSLVSILPACSTLAGLMTGKQIHGFAIRKQLNHDTAFFNALIDMYAKCGGLKCATQVFEDGSFLRDAISWSSMICGYGFHGKGEEAVFLYDQMLHLGNQPDMITVVGVLSACVRSGLIDEGLRIYHAAINEHGINPTLEICSCVVDMLGRSGKLDQALNFIKTMPIQHGPSVWGALVCAAAMHGNLEMQDLAYRFLIQLEPENPSNYVSLSNLHALSRKWDGVAQVRTMMKEKGLRKAPGCSWITIQSKTHSFYAADKTHLCSSSIYEMLDGLKLLMKGTSLSLYFEIFA
ncbi:pentatricopeptide repeat-containing protein At3g12770-like [Tripterygium wilfordii]|uniref:pentatricopeptide repeat-containing protein At3g12770-like n=1 Tax=Tripterygium wilfordii TaxID=458696 RepID=UPI0018F80FF4|nr:pentatricopeptide repeat-containing protein At3g12770-like [Tripterygium wilfordii]